MYHNFEQKARKKLKLKFSACFF